MQDAAGATTADADARRHHTGAVARPVVLYVEDDLSNVMLIQAVFEHRPHWQLHVAMSGAEAMRHACGLFPCLLMLDLGLPDCHGTQLLQQLREVEGCREAAAVAVTGDHTFLLEGSGFNDVWLKPLELMLLFERLDRLQPRPADRVA